MNKRLGEARYSNEGDGMWARVRHDRFGKTNRYEGKNTMTELGYDWKRCDTSYGKHMQGAAVNYTTGSADYKGVTGESSTKRYGLSFYDTQLRETGHYLDTVAKFGRVSNKFTLEQEDENNVNADYHNNYYALSFEYGRKTHWKTTGMLNLRLSCSTLILLLPIIAPAKVLMYSFPVLTA